MIRINLLPFRLARKKENIRQQISIFFLLVALTIFSLWYATIWVDKKIDTVKVKIQSVDTQIAKYREKAMRVQQIKADLKKLEEKLAVVVSLEKQRTKQLVMFDSMTALIIPGRMWLENFKTTPDSVLIKGIAFDNPTIADFMNNLEKSPLFTTVDLKSSTMKTVNENILLMSFEVVCQKATLDSETANPSDKGKK